MSNYEQRALCSLFLVIVLLLVGTSHSLAALINASGLLGQPDYVTRTSYPTSDNTFQLPAYSALDLVNHRLFVSDQYNARVLVFSLNDDNTIANTHASYVLGQTNFTDNVSTTTQSGMWDGVHGVAYDPVHDRLFVVDQANRRVLIFDVNPATISNGENASYVLGQPDFTTSGGGLTPPPTSANRLKTPRGVAYDPAADRLFVSEGGNHRVLIFDVNPATISNGENASYVLGQPGFTTSSPGTSQNTMAGPAGLAFDLANERLFVAEINNRRVLIFDVNPATISNGENASYVLGQPDFISGFWQYDTATTTQDSLGESRGAVYDPLRNLLYVVDSGNSRVMVFDVNPATLASSENATNNIGQPDFTSNQISTTQSSFYDTIRGPSLDPVNNILYVVDARNFRVLSFSLVRLTTNSLLAGSIGESYSQAINVTNTQGVVSFVLASGALPPGLALDNQTGTISGIPTNSGSFTFTVRVEDTYATGSFFDQKTYTITIPDTIPPDISISAPINGGVVSRMVSLVASASDNETLSGVTFKVDGNPIGSMVQTSPYSSSWNSSSVSNGQHTISATAVDLAGNVNTAEIIVTVSNISVHGGGGGPSPQRVHATFLDFEN